MFKEYTYPGGKAGCITLSYDDGQIHDRRLVEIVNRYGIKATFHLNSSNLGKPNYVTPQELPTLYAGHEVSLHCLTHPFPSRIPAHRQLTELTEDKAALEKYWGHPISSMSFPFGDYNRHFLECMDAAGVLYSRTTQSTHSFGWPEDFRLWHPTCHHRENILERFAQYKRYSTECRGMCLYYIRGHSYEFNNGNNWELLEDFCREAAKDEDTWFATGMEIYDYVQACRQLRISCDGSMVYNPSLTTVWGRNEKGESIQIQPGENKV